MSNALGVAEFRSIAKGIEMLDEMTKKANVKIVENRIVCIGRFFVIVSGDVADVTAAIDTLDGLPDSELIGCKVIPRLEPGVTERINGKIERENISAIGVVETRDIHSGLYGANSIKKSSSVEILRISLTLGLGGKALVIFTGDIASVRNGIEAARESMEDPKNIVSAAAIASPSEEFVQNLLR